MSGLKKRTSVPAVYCSAHKTNGDPCRRRPINGGTVCATHGGRAPQVRAAAQRRILAAADRAAAAVVALMEDSETPHAVKLAAAKDLLDRAGLSSKTELSVEVPQWEAAISRILVDDPGDQPARLELSAEQIEWNAEVTEPAAWDPASIEPEVLEAEVEAELVERRKPAPAKVQPASLSSKPLARLDPDGLARRTAARKRTP